MIRRLPGHESGAAMLMVLAVIALTTPIVVGILGLASTLAIDSGVKADITRSQYTAIGANEHATYRLFYESGYSDGLKPEHYIFCTLAGGPRTYHAIDLVLMLFATLKRTETFVIGKVLPIHFRTQASPFLFVCDGDCAPPVLNRSVQWYRLARVGTLGCGVHRPVTCAPSVASRFWTD